MVRSIGVFWSSRPWSNGVCLCLFSFLVFLLIGRHHEKSLGSLFPIVSTAIFGCSSLRSYALFEARSGIFRRSSLNTRLVVVFAVIFRSDRYSLRPRRSSRSRRVTNTRQEVLSPWSVREGHVPSSRSWWLVFGGPWWLFVAGRSPEPTRVTHAQSLVAQKLHVWPDLCWFFLPCYFFSCIS
jgi:hypothetical protein